MATPVLTKASTATRASGSSLMMASSTASEIWSAILSGWPSDTDSEVKIVYSLMVMSPFTCGALCTFGCCNGAKRVQQNYVPVFENRYAKQEIVFLRF